ncbi:MAG: transposase [Deltaproteobacteria bacterium]|jgi:transposase-like protein|nr:transposase [Deltaproteobacteria bacterium]MBW2498399.1 transposase [Deltaproteobacteria bacterium]
MRKSRYSDRQIALALQQVEHGAMVGEVCPKLGISEQTFYRWKKKFGGMAQQGPSSRKREGFSQTYTAGPPPDITLRQLEQAERRNRAESPVLW